MQTDQITTKSHLQKFTLFQSDDFFQGLHVLREMSVLLIPWDLLPARFDTESFSPEVNVKIFATRGYNVWTFAKKSNKISGDLAIWVPETPILKM